MITIFSTPRKMEGVFNLIQSNSFENWSKIKQKPQIIIFGDEAGVEEKCRHYGFDFIPDIKINDEGLPYVNDLFEKAKSLAQYNVLMYTNADILFEDKFQEIIKFLSDKEEFLCVGQRHDVDVDFKIDFTTDWQYLLKQNAILHAPTGKDYFIFSKKYFNDFDIPDFVVGRPGWDDYIVHHSIMKNKRIVDLTKVLCVFHQNHTRDIVAVRPTDISSLKNLSLCYHQHEVVVSVVTKIPFFLTYTDKKSLGVLIIKKRYFIYLIIYLIRWFNFFSKKLST